MQIRQLQVAHDAVQDRLLIRVATQNKEEYRIWLTRRFLGQLWPHLVGRLAASVAATAGNAAQPSFEHPFRDDDTTYPLGSKPILSSEIKFDQLADGGVGLNFREGRERSFHLVLTPDLLHAFCAMLRSAGAKAGWGLALDYAAGETAMAPPPPASTRLH